MVTETEVTPATEAPSPDGQAAPAEAAPAAPAEEQAPAPAPEVQPSEDEEIDRKAKELTDSILGKADEEPTPAAKMLSEEEAAERERRAAQSAADKARAEAQAEQQRQNEAAQATARMNAQRRADIHANLGRAVASVAPSLGITDMNDINAVTKAIADVALDGIDSRYEGAMYERAAHFVGQADEQAMIVALANVPGMTEAKEEDFAPIFKPHKTPQDKFGAYFEVAVEQGKKLGLAEAEKKMAKEVARQVREGTEAGLKKALRDMRLGEKGGELPKAVGSTSGTISDAEYAAHRNDPVGPDGFSDWYRANREQILRQQGKRD